MSKITKYEEAKLIGVRATQLSQGAEPMIDITGFTDAYTIAVEEYKRGRIPLLIERKFPRGKQIVNPNVKN